jgi:hypothetical protein
LATSIVAQSVDAPVPCKNRRNRALYTDLVANIALVRRNLTTNVRKLRCNGGKLRTSAANDRNLRTERGKFMCDASANSAAAAGDDVRSSVKRIAAENGPISIQR